TVTGPSGQTAAAAVVTVISSTTANSCPTSLRSTGTIHYFCDCQTGAQSGCVAGSDANSGLTPAQAKQSLSAMVTAFKALNAGDTVALCQGGSWTTTTALAINNNPRCSGSGSLRSLANSTTCDLTSYAPSWGGTAQPILKQTTAKTNLLQMWGGPSGVRIMNLD